MKIGHYGWICHCWNHVWSFLCHSVKESSDIPSDWRDPLTTAAPPNLPAVQGVNDSNIIYAAISATIRLQFKIISSLSEDLKLKHLPWKGEDWFPSILFFFSSDLLILLIYSPHPMSIKPQRYLLSDRKAMKMRLWRYRPSTRIQK